MKIHVNQTKIEQLKLFKKYILIGQVTFLGQNTGIQKPYPQKTIPQKLENPKNWVPQIME